MDASSKIAVLVAAAGRGSRAGDGPPKQYRPLLGKSILARTLDAMHAACPEARLAVAIHPDDAALYEESVAQLSEDARARLIAPVIGGATRQESVRNGLEALARLSPAPEIALIHDAARPFADAALVARAIEAARAFGAAVPGLPLTDTVKRIDAAGAVIETADRAALRTVQTPQAFGFGLILAAHRAAAASDASGGLTDDAMVAEAAGHRVHVFAGDPANFKLTAAEDFARAETALMRELPDVRIGQGYDVHAFGPGDRVWLGGVAVPHAFGLVGHSDADVLTHAVTDAILGALADGDIGAHFPPSEARWKGAVSAIFLAEAARRVRNRGGAIAHVDATIVCEAPRIGPYRDSIRASLAKIMGIEEGRVAVKATTSERLGFTGRNEGMAALAVATVRLPATPIWP